MSTQPQIADASAPRIGRWVISTIPPGWTWTPGFGIHKPTGPVTSNICLKDDELLAGNQLDLYIRAQITLLNRTFQEPMIAGPAPFAFPNAAEAALLMVKHRSLQQASVFQVQNYVRIDRWIGVVTLTTIESELLKVRPDFDQFVQRLQIVAPAG
ncbi:MAG TPA: hypothetical protein VHE33_07300 [Acidobacteriaceae bacterium]|nr:hypothetical protein [Acidobacteriaceae bacterium]